MDLSEWVSRRRVVALLDLIEQLPEASRFREAMLQDPERAKEVADELTAKWAADEAAGIDSSDDEIEDEWAPNWRDWTLQTRLLRDMYDLLSVQTTYLAALAGVRNPNKPDPYPVPQSALMVELARRSVEAQLSFIERLDSTSEYNRELRETGQLVQMGDFDDDASVPPRYSDVVDVQTHLDLPPEI